MNITWKFLSFLQARPIGGTPDTPYRYVQTFDKLTTTLWDECNTLDDLFARAVQLFNDKPCLGYRECLSEEDETQPSGKVFKKVCSLLFEF
jgi:long-chain acyl-CoA synthetase